LAYLQTLPSKKKVEDELRKSREHYQLLLDISPDAIVETGTDGKILFCNQRKALLFVYDSPEELIGADSLQFMPPEDIVIARNNAGELLEKGFMNNVQYTMLRKDGSQMQVEVNARLVRDKYGVPTSFLGSIRDITERREAESVMQQMNLELNQKNKELEQILYVTSHDLRSPLVNIEGFSKELAYSLEELTSHLNKHKNAPGIPDRIDAIVHQDIPESMKFILESAKKMNGLISGILKLSRTGKVELKIEEINMDQMVLDVLLNFEFMLHEKGINTNISSLPVCRGDVNHLGQLFANLIDNAIKYLDPERSGRIQISGYKDNDQSVYCIEDNGIGIAPDYQSRIFEIFHQLDPETYKGEGLGLTIAHRIVEMHNGKIWIESEPEKGSRFFISIPA
jgi:PAS domain S-box-containing protein